MKFCATNVTAGCLNASPTIEEGMIFKPTGETYNGKPKYAKFGNSPPYIWWSGDGFPLTNPTPAGACYCVSDDGSQGFNFSGIYVPDPQQIPNPPDDSSCVYYRRSGSPAATLRAIPQSGSCSDNYWQLSGGGVELDSEGRTTRNGLPYEGHYGPAPHADPPWVYAAGAEAIPANKWILSDYPSAEALDAAYTGACIVPWFLGQTFDSPAGDYGSGGTCSLCSFTLEEYHYPSPSCYRVTKDTYYPPNVDMAGDYMLGNPPVYYPPDDDEDRPVYSNGTYSIFFFNNAWWVGPTVGEARGYRLPYEGITPPRTPIRGIYDGYPTTDYTGKHKVGFCSADLWFPWCCRPCPPPIEVVSRPCVSPCPIILLDGSAVRPSRAITMVRISLRTQRKQPTWTELASWNVNCAEWDFCTVNNCDDVVTAVKSLDLPLEQCVVSRPGYYNLGCCGEKSSSCRVYYGHGNPASGEITDAYGNEYGLVVFFGTEVVATTATTLTFRYVLIVSRTGKTWNSYESHFVSCDHRFVTPDYTVETTKFPALDYIVNEANPAICRVKVTGGTPRPFTAADVGKKLIRFVPATACMELLSGPDAEGYMTAKTSAVPPTGPWWVAPDMVAPAGANLQFAPDGTSCIPSDAEGGLAFTTPEISAVWVTRIDEMTVPDL